jgi:CRP/FNR family transcriptional regulator, cyclic AMP receptor protein
MPETLADAFTILRRAPLFGGIPDDAVHTLVDLAEVRALAPGEVVVREGDLARDIFLVLDGHLAVEKSGARLHTMGRGDCAGEMSLIDIQPRSATIIAVEPTRIVVLGYERLMGLCQTNLETYTLVMLNAAREVSRRLRQTSEALASEISGEGKP